MNTKNMKKFETAETAETAVPKSEVVPYDKIVNVESGKTPEGKTSSTGVVTQCKRLNVRRTPNHAAKVLDVVEFGSRLSIFEDDSNENFYKVETESGVIGFCMKEFIDVV